MANPLFIDLTSGIGQWTKIASSISSMTVHRNTSSAIYYMTYKTAGEAAPTAVPIVAQWIFQNKNSEGIVVSPAVDVYIWVAEGAIDPEIEVQT